MKVNLQTEPLWEIECNPSFLAKKVHFLILNKIPLYISEIYIYGDKKYQIHTKGDSGNQ